MKIRTFETIASFTRDVGAMADARLGSSLCVTATAGGSSSLPASLSLFVDTWVSAPARIAPVPRDFSFKAVVGEPSW